MIRHYFSRMILLIAVSLSAFGLSLLSGCASTVDPASYAQEKPVLDLSQYFNGKLDAWGVVTDRSGKVIRRFTVAMTGTWTGPADARVGVLEEDFVYADGKKERRVWTLKKGANGKYEGTAADVVGVAYGQASGNALNWGYTLRLPVDDKVYDVQFDDWMWLVDERVMINKAVMTKFGFKLAEITISFTKR
jgi:hypothetical protein